MVFNPGSAREFTPANYDVNSTAHGNSAHENGGVYDPFTTMSSVNQQLPSAGQFNPYAADANAMAGSTPAFYSQQYQGALVTPPNYHLYQPYGEYRADRPDLSPWERTTYDFFLPRALREDMQKKSFATQQVMMMSQGLPMPSIERYHNLVALDTNLRKSTVCFNYNSWVYKARNDKNGRHYALRRLEGYRLTNEQAIPHVTKVWKQIRNSCIVTVHDIFTSREFGDSSLIFAYDYHPLSKTLQEVHFPQNTTGTRFKNAPTVPEDTLWGYICQIASALKTIHTHKLAARCLDLSKIIVDSKRIRLAACAILDVVQYESGAQKPLEDLQHEDLVKFGKLILALATNTLPSHLNDQSSLEFEKSNKYTPLLKQAVKWLLAPASPTEPKIIANFITGIADKITEFFDATLQDGDEMRVHLGRELENGRCARLMMKLDIINDNPDVQGMPKSWSEKDRYYLKLFRDYVFHQVDGNGKPHISIGHMLSCLNKLDAGIEELVPMTTPDNLTSVVISYRELKNMVERCFNELLKHKSSGAS